MATAPLAHLTPFVEAIAAARMAAGENLNAAMLGECIRQAAAEDDRRCVELAGLDHYASARGQARRQAGMAIIAGGIHSRA